MKENEIEIFYPTNKAAWRAWLQENHNLKQSVWLVQYKKLSEIPSISWAEAVEEALCFGWIDSKKIAIDTNQTHQFFSKRKAKSTWSKINKNIVQKLIKEDLMSKAGLECIKIAKANGSWSILDEVEELIIPKDLKFALENNLGAADFFDSLSKSIKKMMLQWIVLAKRPETRQNRIDEIARLATQKLKPKQF
jgi:uncharacterized protein YdeI (YjbR/CyaY-like superfamily)